MRAWLRLWLLGGDAGQPRRRRRARAGQPELLAKAHGAEPLRRALHASRAEPRPGVPHPGVARPCRPRAAAADPESPQPALQSGVVTVLPLPIRVPAAADAGRGSPGGRSPQAKRRRLGQDAGEAAEGGSGAEGEAGPRPAAPGDGQLMLAYGIRMADRPGKFQPAKAKALGVPYGPVSAPPRVYVLTRVYVCVRVWACARACG